MPIELKICGINSENIIQTIIQNGSCQYLGFVFYPPSPRNLSIDLIIFSEFIPQIFNSIGINLYCERA